MLSSENRYYRAKNDQLLIERLADGSLAICDRRSRCIHSLNASVARVWEACADGATLAEIAAALEGHFGTPVEDEVLHGAISQLQSARLISSDEPLAASAFGIARRALLRTFGVAVPTFLTFAVPAAATTQHSHPANCGLYCFDQAAAAYEACLAGGGSFAICFPEMTSDYELCLEACQEGPAPTPAPTAAVPRGGEKL